VLKDTDGWRRRDIYYGGVGGAHTTIDMDSLLRTRGFFITLIDIALEIRACSACREAGYNPCSI
jgi:hypothetical protein